MAYCGPRIDKNKTFLTLCFFQLGKGGAKGRGENRRGARQPPTSFHLKCPCRQWVQVKGQKEALHFIEVYSFDCYFA